MADSYGSTLGRGVVAQSQLRLCSVLQMCEDHATTTNVNIVTIPGYGMPPVNSWRMMHELEQVAASANAIPRVSRLFLYSYVPPYDEEGKLLSWKWVSAAGKNMARHLAQLATEAPNTPLVFISHSLGGVVLKKAILEAYQSRQDPRWRSLVSGIIFMGTPHSGNSDKDTLRRYNQILYSCCRVTVQDAGTRPPREEVFRLASLATDFEQIATMPILSVFEIGTAASPVPLVNQQLASVSSSKERLLGVPLAHSDLCNLSMLGDDSGPAEFFCLLLEQPRGASPIKFHDAAKDMFAAPLPGVNIPPPNPQHAAFDPLNPLNLLPLVKRWERFDTQEERGDDNSSLLSSLHPSLRIHAIPRTNTTYLETGRKVGCPSVTFSRYRNPHFMGRDDAFKVLDTHLLKADPQTPGKEHYTRIVGLCGASGIGKTDLATEYAFRRRSRFAAVFWLQANSTSQLTIDFGRVAIQLGLHAVDEERSLESSVEATMSWLTDNQHSEGWLLVFDNADNLDVIADFVPRRGQGSVLVISRSPVAETHFILNGAVINMTPLSVTESALLLRKLVTGSEAMQIPDDENAYIELAEHTGGLPSAISQIAGFVRSRKLSVREFARLHRMDHGQEKIGGLDKIRHQSLYSHAVAACLNELSHNATRLLGLVAFMDPHRIQEYIFSDVQVSEDGRTNSWSADVFNSVCAELVACSIIKKDVDKCYSICRLLQAEVRNSIGNNLRFQAFEAVVALLLQEWPTTEDFVMRWALCEELLPHLEQCYQLYTVYKKEWECFKVDMTLPMLLNKAAIYLRERGFAYEGSKYVRLAFSLCARDNIAREPLMSDLHLAMGGLSNESNDAHSSLEHNIQCFSIRRTEVARNRVPDLRFAFAHNQLGISFMMAGKISLATAYFKQNIEILNFLEAAPDEFGFPVCNLGLAYWLQGRLDEADATLTTLLAQRQKLRGTLDMVNYKYKLGRVLHALGNVKASKALRSAAEGNHDIAAALWEESFEMHTDCLTQYQSTSQRFNHRTADICYKLAEHHIRRKEHGSAQYYLHRALCIWGDQKSYQNESARGSFLRGLHLRSIREIDIGDRWLERARSLRREILPDEEPRDLEAEDFDDLVCFWSI